MDTNTLLASLRASLGAQLPAVFGALAILALGWIVAVIARAGLMRLLAIVKLDERLRTSMGPETPGLEKPLALTLFWLILLVTLVAVFNALNLETVSAPFAALVAQILGYLPHLAGGALLAALAWGIASALRALLAKLLANTTLDDRLARDAGMEPMSRNLANVLYWLVLLLFLPIVLDALQLDGLLAPVRNMVDKLLAMLPNVFAGALIGFVGWAVAGVLRGLVANLLAAVGADALGTRLGLDESVKLSRLSGTLVFILVFVPSLIAALDAMKMEALSRPATDMLQQVLTAVPNILAAGLILVLTWYVAGFAANLLARLLAGAGFDLLPARSGLGHLVTEERKASDMVGYLVRFFAMLFAVVEASNRLGFGGVRDLVEVFIRFGGDILLGAVILVVGFWLANLAHEAIDKASGARTAGLAGVARIAILGLVIAMGLRAMGIADDIVNLAFGLSLGAVAVAVALSFGLGGREAAGRQMEHWLSRLREEKRD